MKRRIVSITGSRADYGLMQSVHRAIDSDNAFELHLIATGMHFAPEFCSSLKQVRSDRIGKLHEVPVTVEEDSGMGMARSIGQILLGVAERLPKIQPDIMLLQGDRGEMLAAAIAGAHLNIPIVHMSGGDFSGSIDDSVRNAISKFAHFHLTTCDMSTQRLIAMGESSNRIVEVGEPGLDLLGSMKFLSRKDLSQAFELPTDQPYLLATLHPTTDEADQAKAQMTVTLESLAELAIPTVFTYPNTDHGGWAMRDELESWREKPFLRINPDLGSLHYLSLMRFASAVVGNSSSGIIEAPSFKVPVVNIGSRQRNRLRANNVVDVPFERDAIVKAVKFVQHDPEFRKHLSNCINPYGDGKTSGRVVEILARLKLCGDLIAKASHSHGSFLTAANAD